MKRKKFINIIILICLSMFLLISCSDDDNDKSSPGDILDPGDIDPSDADIYVQMIEFAEMDHRNGERYLETVIIAVDPELFELDLDLSINGEPVEVEGFYNTWYVDYDFQEGSNYLIEMSIGGREYSITAKVLYFASETIFPEHYHPSQSAKVTWNLAGNNQNQIAGAYSYLEEGQESEYMRAIKPSDREVEFAAGIVEDYGEETEYSLAIMQWNLQRDNGVMAMGWSVREVYYNDYGTQRDIKERAARILDSFQEFPR